MKAIIKRYVSNNIFLYYLWFKLVRQRKGINVDFFQKDTDVYIDGFPRSGNTFIIHMVKCLIPELKLVHHLHAVAPVKIAFLLDLPVFILLRNPMDCLSSQYLKHFSMRGMNVDSNNIDVKLLDFYIYDYLNYYDFVYKNIDKISLIHFDELVNSTDLVLNHIQDQMGLKKIYTAEDFLEAKKSYRGATNTMGSSRPNEKKEKYKSIIKEYIIDSNKYSELLKLYDSITTDS